MKKAVGVLAVLVLAAGAMFWWREGARVPVAGTFGDLMTSGWDYFRTSEYGAASERFRGAAAAARAAGDARGAMQARYALATTLWLRSPGSDPDAARAEFAAILASDPAGEMAPWCKLSLVRMGHLVNPGELPDYPALLRGYEDLYRQYPDLPAGQEAFMYYNATLQAQTGRENMERSRDELRAFLQQHPQAPFQSNAWGLLSVAEHELGNAPASLAAKIRAVETAEIDPTNPKQDNSNAFWYIATYAEFSVGDLTTARTYYKKLMEEYPRDRRNFASMQALLRMQKLEEELRAGKAPAQAVQAAKAVQVTDGDPTGRNAPKAR